MGFKLSFIINGLSIASTELAANELYIKGITFQDRVTGDADQLDIEILDPEDKWKNGFIPEKGDEWQIKITDGNRHNFTSPAVFIDKINWGDSTSAISTCTLGGLSLLYEKGSSIRKRRSAYYENTTLRTIVSGIAQRNGFTLNWFGTDVQLPPVEQKKMSDYSFLEKLAKEQGAFVKYIKKNLIFATATDDLSFETNGNTVTATTGSGTRFIEIDKKFITDRTFELKANNKTKLTWEAVDVFNKRLNRTLGDFSSDLDLGSTSARNKLTGREKAAEGTVTNAILGDTVAGFTYFVSPDGPLAQELLAGSVVYFMDAGKLVGTYRIKDVAHNLSATGGYVIDGQLERLTSNQIATTASAKSRYKKRVDKAIAKDKALYKTTELTGIGVRQDNVYWDPGPQTSSVDGQRRSSSALNNNYGG